MNKNNNKLYIKISSLISIIAINFSIRYDGNATIFIALSMLATLLFTILCDMEKNKLDSNSKFFIDFRDSNIYFALFLLTIGTYNYLKGMKIAISLIVLGTIVIVLSIYLYDREMAKTTYNVSTRQLYKGTIMYSSFIILLLSAYYYFEGLKLLIVLMMLSYFIIIIYLYHDESLKYKYRQGHNRIMKYCDLIIYINIFVIIFIPSKFISRFISTSSTNQIFYSSAKLSFFWPLIILFIIKYALVETLKNDAKI